MPCLSLIHILVFGVKGLLDTNNRLRDTMLFNILSFMSNQLLREGNTAASIDELYLFLTNLTAIEYIRNCRKRVRKKDSSIILASQNIEDLLIPGIREYTKPLFSIPTHQFLFNAGQINPKEYMDALQVESEMCIRDSLTAESQSDGLFTFENVPYGAWIIKELRPADGFLPNEEVYPVKVTEDEEVIEITAYNDRIPEIGTQAAIEGEKEANATEVFTLEDTVFYEHLVPDREYAVSYTHLKPGGSGSRYGIYYL